MYKLKSLSPSLPLSPSLSPFISLLPSLSPSPSLPPSISLLPPSLSLSPSLSPSFSISPSFSLLLSISLSPSRSLSNNLFIYTNDQRIYWINTQNVFSWGLMRLNLVMIFRTAVFMLIIVWWNIKFRLLYPPAFIWCLIHMGIEIVQPGKSL